MTYQEEGIIYPCEEVTGVYFLLDQHNKVLYVGSSTDIHTRVRVHVKDDKKEFSGFAYKAMPNNSSKADLENEEAYFIWKYNPPLNNRIPTAGNWCSVRQLLKTTSVKKQKEYAQSYSRFHQIDGCYYVDLTSKNS